MSLIEFKDLPNTTTPLTANNLNNNFNELKPYILYSNSTGDNSEITLSDDVSNYSYIEIYGAANNVCSFQKIDNPADKTFGVNLSYNIDNTMITLLTRYTFDDNKITPVLTNCGYSVITTAGNSMFYLDGVNYFYITKVVGYK